MHQPRFSGMLGHIQPASYLGERSDQLPEKMPYLDCALLPDPAARMGTTREPVLAGRGGCDLVRRVLDQPTAFSLPTTNRDEWLRVPVQDSSESYADSIPR